MRPFPRRDPRATSRAAATAGSHRTPTHSTSNPSKAFCHRRWDVRSAEEDVIDDDAGAGPGHRGDPGHPRRFQLPELRSDMHSTVSSELDACGRCLHGRGHRFDQRVDRGGKPRIAQQRLQTPQDPGLTRAGPAVQDDHLRCHPVTVEATAAALEAILRQARVAATVRNAATSAVRSGVTALDGLVVLRLGPGQPAWPAEPGRVPTCPRAWPVPRCRSSRHPTASKPATSGPRGT